MGSRYLPKFHGYIWNYVIKQGLPFIPYFTNISILIVYKLINFYDMIILTNWQLIWYSYTFVVFDENYDYKLQIVHYKTILCDPFPMSYFLVLYFMDVFIWYRTLSNCVYKVVMNITQYSINSNLKKSCGICLVQVRFTYSISHVI